MSLPPGTLQAMTSVALVTCAALPGLDPDEARVIAPLTARGVTATPVVWDDDTVDWNDYDLAVLRCAWDYSDRRRDFLAWADRVPRLHNPGALIAWNTDKRYLGDLAASGVPVVPTTWLPPGIDLDLPDTGTWVLKPTVAAGSRDAGRYDLADPTHRELAEQHVARLHTAGATVMLQPYLDDVDANGERALIFIDGQHSHTIRKGAMLDGPYTGLDGLYKEERITPATATDAELAAARAVLAAIPDPNPPLYARVDLIDHRGEPVLLELELAEPSLFLGHHPGAADTLAAAIVARLD